MSAESSEPRPSFDDILFSIRQMIADENADDEGSGSAQDDAPASAVANGNHDHNPAERAPPEDVLDLSEEFIVSEVASAERREEDQYAQPEPEVSGAQTPETADTSESPAAEAEEASPDEDAGIAAADVWSRDFQMPVGEGGPASPFTAAQTHPDSAWPGDDPFDVTDLYSRARSRSPHGRTDEPAGPPEMKEAAVDASEEDDEAARTQEGAAPTGHDAGEQGLELASLSTQQQAEDAGEPAEDAPAEEQTAEEQEADRQDLAGQQDLAGENSEQAFAPAARRLDAAAEIEAAFGMPRHSWAAAEPAQPEARDRAPEDEQQPMSSGKDFSAAGSRDIFQIDAAGEDADHADAAHASHAAAAPLSEPHPDPARWQKAAEALELSRMEPEQTSGSVAEPTAKSLEDSVKELLRPMLAEWLDKNMPRLVEAAMREQMAAGQEQQATQRQETDDEPAPTSQRYGTQR